VTPAIVVIFQFIDINAALQQLFALAASFST